MRAKIVGDARKLLLFTMVPAAALAAGCADSSAPNQAPAAAIAATAQVQAKPGRGIDAEFTRLAKEIPGFGGMYYDKSGRLTVQVVKPQAGAAARSPDVVGRLRSVGGATVQRRLAQSGTAIVREAKYDYGQLQSWKGNLSKIFGVRGVVYTDTDEEQNRVRIGITPAASQRDVEQAVARAGVPRDAVVFSRISAIKRVQTLQDRLRPVPGGAQLVFPARSEGPGAFFLCTLGFNARLPGQSREFFVTASHCSDIQGGDQNTPYFQPTPFVRDRNSNRVAVEFKDPAYGNPGGLCYEGFRCRLSDALLARYFGSVESGFGKIARTTFGLQRIGSLIIDRNRP
ncbi:MAG: hypothetical protein H0T44_08145, partial [Gemmatimonadales bacterium]|nr:hypothetical protein [Gemmatimonadales bacterium]